jgi:WD40 repeat protein
MSQRPYPGLRAFWRDEIDIFFGRERQIDEILEKLQKSHFLAVLGPSGCGKSSLMRTGVLSALDSGFMCRAGAHWLVADMKPGSSPFLALAQALLDDDTFAEHYRHWFPASDGTDENAWKQEAQYFLQASLQRGPQSLHELLNDLQLPEGSTLLLLVDQFEEVFRYQRHASNEATEFVSLILAASKHPSVYSAMTMRSEFLGNCVEFNGLPEAINQGLYLTPSLDRDQLSDAIAFPARVFGGDVTPELVNRLLNDAGQSMDQLPLLQHALMRLWDTDDNEQLTLEEYEATGGLQSMLNDHLDEAWSELDSEQQQLAEHLFKMLTEKTPEGHSIRRPIKFSEAMLLPGANRENILKVIEVFRADGRHFLMPPASFELSPDTVIDITHESLIRQWRRLNKWVDLEAEQSHLYQRLEGTALRHQQGEAALLVSPDLEIALHWRDTQQPTAAWSQRYGKHFDDVMVLLDKSVEAKQAQVVVKEAQEKSRSRRTFLSIVLGFAIAIGAAVTGWLANANSKEKLVITKNELTQEQVSQQKLIVENNDLRYQTKEAAQRLPAMISSSPNSDAAAEAYDKKIYEAFMTQARLYIDDGRFWEARKVLLDVANLRTSSSPEISYKLNLMLRKLAITGVSPSQRFDLAKVPLHSVALDVKKNALVGVGEDGWIYIYTRGKAKPKYQFQTPNKMHIQDVAIDPTGEGFATVDDGGRIIRWLWKDVESSPKVLSWQSDSGAAKALAYSPDGKHLVVGYTGAVGRVRYFEVGDNLKLLWTGQQHASQISEGGLGFTPTGLVVSASHDGSVRFWKADVDKETEVLKPLKHTKPVLGMSFSKDGKLLATASGQQVYIWDWEKGEQLYSFISGHEDLIFSLKWVEDQFGIERLVTASMDHSLRLWKVAPEQNYNVLLEVMEGHKGEVGVSQMAYDKNMRQLFSPGKDGAVLQWTTDLPYLQLLNTGLSKPLRTALNESGSLLAVGLSDGRVQIYSTTNYALLIDREVGSDVIEALAFDPNNERIAVISREPNLGSKLTLWAYTETGGFKREAEFKGYDGGITHVLFNPDGSSLWLGTADGHVGHLNLPLSLDTTLRYSKRLHGNDNSILEIESLSLSADGNYLLTSSKRSIKNWELSAEGLPEGEPFSTLETKYSVYGAQFTPDEKSVLAVGRGSNVNRYPLKNMQLSNKPAVSLNGHSQTVLEAHFIPEANAAITIGSDAELYVWDLSNDKALFSLRVPTYKGVPMPLSRFSSSCNKGGCRFAVPLKGKRNEEGQVVIYDFMFRSRSE